MAHPAKDGQGFSFRYQSLAVAGELQVRGNYCRERKAQTSRRKLALRIRETPEFMLRMRWALQCQPLPAFDDRAYQLEVRHFAPIVLDWPLLEIEMDLRHMLDALVALQLSLAHDAAVFGALPVSHHDIGIVIGVLVKYPCELCLHGCPGVCGHLAKLGILAEPRDLSEPICRGASIDPQCTVLARSELLVEFNFEPRILTSRHFALAC